MQFLLMVRSVGLAAIVAASVAVPMYFLFYFLAPDEARFQLEITAFSIFLLTLVSPQHNPFKGIRSLLLLDWIVATAMPIMLCLLLPGSISLKFARLVGFWMFFACGAVVSRRVFGLGAQDKKTQDRI